jgi:glycyl-tRNA synthetase alpha chain
VSQFHTYFQQVSGHDIGELTYGLERLAMYILRQDRNVDVRFQRPRRSVQQTSSADPKNGMLEF